MPKLLPSIQQPELFKNSYNLRFKKGDPVIYKKKIQGDLIKRKLNFARVRTKLINRVYTLIIKIYVNYY